MPDSDRCASHLGLAGRPIGLTPDVAQRVVEQLRATGDLQTALASVGVCRRTFQRWMRRDDPGARDFRARVEQARAQVEASNVLSITRASRADWRAAAWMLEHEFPQRWGPPLRRGTRSAR